MIRRVAWGGGWVVLMASFAAGQEGTVSRTDLGDPVSAEIGGSRYWENTGWNSPMFADPTWGVVYGQELSPDPWTVVFQGDRTNATFTAAANKLTLDLNGGRYDVAPYRLDGTTSFKGGEFNVYDGTGSGSYLRVTNGVLGSTIQVPENLNVSHYGKIFVGGNGHSGKLIVDRATVEAKEIHVGGSAGSPGELILNDQARVDASTSSKIFVGSKADGTVLLNGAGSELAAREIRIGNTLSQASGTIVVNHAEAVVRSVNGNMFIKNVAPTNLFDNLGLDIKAGLVEVNGDLRLGVPGSSTTYGAVRIDGGTLKVDGVLDIVSASSPGQINGGKLFLNGGELAVTNTGTGTSGFGPAATEEFYWKAGTVRYTESITLTADQIHNLTNQGATTYKGDRQAGAFATGQTLISDGSLQLLQGANLAGGTIRAAGPLTVSGTLSGYGTLDAVVDGTGTLTSTSGSTLEIGALSGANPLNGDGEFRVGHLNQDATFGGTVTGGGTFRKVGSGTQTVTGSLSNTGGVFVEEGRLAFGSGASLETSNVSVGASGSLDLLSGSTGLLTGSISNAGLVTVSGGSLTVDGDFINEGWLINNGTMTASVTGSGKISGSGSITGTVDVLAGSTLAPGNSVGTIAVENLSLDGGGLLELEIASAQGIAGTDWDLVAVSELLSITAGVADPIMIMLASLDSAGMPGLLETFDAGQSYSWQFVSAPVGDPSQWTPDQFLVDTTGFITAEAPAGNFSVSSAADGLYLNYSIQPAAVPEPSSGVLLLTLVPAWHCWRRWRAT